MQCCSPGYFNPRSPCGISIHAPLAGSDTSSTIFTLLFKLFQSTLPLRGATFILISSMVCIHYFNPRSPCGERPKGREWRVERWHFNPRSPCGERRSPAESYAHPWHFNPRSPCGERPCRMPALVLLFHFNPRSPCGERPIFNDFPDYPNRFQSTLPLRGATT